MHSIIIVTCMALLVTSSVEAYNDLSPYLQKYMTFNTALVTATEFNNPQSIGSEDLRLEAVIAALNSSTADIICLQEVFDGLDVQKIIEGVPNFPYSFSDIHDESGQLPNQDYDVHPPPCMAGFDEFLPFLGCFENCSAFIFNLEEFIQCFIDGCKEELTSIFLLESQECVTCLFSYIPNLGRLEQRCTANILSNDTENANMNTPGLVILSKKKLHDAEYVDFHPGATQVIRRGFLRSKFDNKWTAVCTHLSSPSFPFFEPQLNFTSYAQQNLFESQILIDMFSAIKKSVIGGDFNSGLAFVPGLVDILPASYHILNNAFRTMPELLCTLCDNTENTFRSVGSSRFVVEHLFGGSQVTFKNTVRTMTGTFNYPPPNLDLNLSDHFGVMSEFVICYEHRRYDDRVRDRNYRPNPN